MKNVKLVNINMIICRYTTRNIEILKYKLI